MQSLQKKWNVANCQEIRTILKKYITYGNIKYMEVPKGCSFRIETQLYMVQKSFSFYENMIL